MSLSRAYLSVRIRLFPVRFHICFLNSRCREDSSLSRGYSQSSTVVLSPLPLYVFYRASVLIDFFICRFATKLHHLHSSYGFAILPVALEAVDDWQGSVNHLISRPFPRAGEQYSLSFMDTSFEAIIPDSPSLRLLLQRRRTLSVSSPKHSPGNLIRGDLLGSPTLSGTAFPFTQDVSFVLDEQTPELNSRRVSGLFEVGIGRSG